MRLILSLLVLTLPRQDSGDVVIADNAVQVQAAVDAEGNIYAAFIRNGNIEFSLSKDQGKTFSKPLIALDAKGKLKGGVGIIMQRGPRIGVDAKKNIYITAPACLDESEFEKQYPTAEQWLVASTDGGATFGKPVRINEVPRKATEGLHWMAVAANGDVHIAWLDFREGKKDIYYAKVTDQGRKVGKNVTLGGPVCECCAPGLALDGKGNPLIAYREGGRKASREICALLSSDGGKSFKGPVQINRTSTKVDS